MKLFYVLHFLVSNITKTDLERKFIIKKEDVKKIKREKMMFKLPLGFDKREITDV